MARPTTTFPTGSQLALGLSAVCLALTVTSTANAAPRSPAWQARYDRARESLLEERPDEAAREFGILAATADNPEDRLLASELQALTQLKLRALTRPQPALRTSDELTLLYTTAVIYGLGTSAWMALIVKPKSLGAAVLPFAAITTAAVGGVALADGYRPFRLGVPQSISAGLYLGFGEGIWAVGIDHARAARLGDDSAWESEMVATVLWSGATLGGVVGGVVGALRQPTPGRVSFIASTSLWGGVLASFSAAALEPSTERRTETSFVVGTVGYNVGLVGGLVFAPTIAPSVARVRFVDLAGIGGGLIGAGTYNLFAGDNAKTELSLGTTALGTAVGLGISWWATRGMPSDPGKPHTAHTSTLMPSVTRTPGGWLAGVAGEL
jgi:hypothetical protein